MKTFYLFLLSFIIIATESQAQIGFDPEIEVDFITDVVLVPSSPLKFQVLFVGGHDTVQTTATYGNPAGQALAKQWNDFVGFTPDTSGQSLGWISVNHERVVQDDNIGDGGGMTVFRVMRDATNDSLMIVPQTLNDGRSGKYFNVDFVNHTGETGMNCGGITSSFDGRIWTAEEWFRSDNGAIADRDTSDFVIGMGTIMGQNAPSGFPGFNGDTIAKYENYNYMTEIDPRQAVAIRKQYNWGRQPFEGGTVLPDNKTVLTGSDGTPGFLTKFVADTPGDFTAGKTYVYKHDAATKWVEIDNSDLDKMLNFDDEAVSGGATMFNRLEWLAYDANSGMVYISETGRDNPGSRWADENAQGAVHAPHTLARATMQGTHPDSSAYWDYYGRVLKFNPVTDEIEVFLEAGPYLANSPGITSYPEIHLSNPDGLNVMNINGQSYLVICEDLNGTSFGRVPGGVSTRTCELYLLDLSISNPQIDDLVRISVAPFGAEITGACPTPDGKTLLVCSQHPNSGNPFPYNNSITYALTGWDQLATNIAEQPEFSQKEAFQVWPNPASRMVHFNQKTDVALYNSEGRRIKVARAARSMDISQLAKGVYYLRLLNGKSTKLVLQ